MPSRNGMAYADDCTIITGDNWVNLCVLRKKCNYRDCTKKTLWTGNSDTASKMCMSVCAQCRQKWTSNLGLFTLYHSLANRLNCFYLLYARYLLRMYLIENYLPKCTCWLVESLTIHQSEFPFNALPCFLLQIRKTRSFLQFS